MTVASRNRHSRRARGASDAGPEALASAIEIAGTQAGGLMELMIISPEDADNLLLLSGRGDRFATMLLGTLTDSLMHIRSAPKSEPILCGCCRRPLKGYFCVATVLPRCHTPSQGVSMAMCKTCTAGSNQEVHKNAISAFREIWPEIRVANLVDQVGSA